MLRLFYESRNTPGTILEGILQQSAFIALNQEDEDNTFSDQLINFASDTFSPSYAISLECFFDNSISEQIVPLENCLNPYGNQDSQTNYLNSTYYMHTYSSNDPLFFDVLNSAPKIFNLSIQNNSQSGLALRAKVLNIRGEIVNTEMAQQGERININMTE
nr:hypothetical protein [uncultured Halomonas sp.]